MAVAQHDGFLSNPLRALAWRTHKSNPLQRARLENPRHGEPGGLPSMGSHRVGHD